MTGGSLHEILVEQLAEWIAHSYFGGDSGCVLKDTANCGSGRPPPRINGYVPDVYALVHKHDLTLIGEAETAGSLESNHTREQVGAFLSWCAKHDGSIFVMAVPWDMVRAAEALLKELKAQCGAMGVTTIVVEKLGG